MRRIAIRVGNALLFVLACFLVASVINRFAAAGLAVQAIAVFAVAPAPVPAPARWADRTVIAERNLFGSRAQPVAVVEVVVDEKLEETRLPLMLLGTAATSDPATARAAISNKSRNRHQVVRVGDHLKQHPKVEVILIEARRVVLQNGAKREEMLLENRELVSRTSSAPSANPASTGKAPPTLRGPRGNSGRARKARKGTSQTQPTANAGLVAALFVPTNETHDRTSTDLLEAAPDGAPQLLANWRFAGLQP